MLCFRVLPLNLFLKIDEDDNSGIISFNIQKTKLHEVEEHKAQLTNLPVKIAG